MQKSEARQFHMEIWISDFLIKNMFWSGDARVEKYQLI